MKIILYLILVISMAVNVSFSEEEHGHDEHKEEHEGEHEEHDSSKAIGEGKAIAEVSEQNGFKLSGESISFLNIKFKKVNGRRFLIKREALAVNRKEKGVYRYRDGFFKFLEATQIEHSKLGLYVTVADIKAGDEVAVDHLDLIKVCDIYSTDTAEYGHGH